MSNERSITVLADKSASAKWSFPGRRSRSDSHPAASVPGPGEYEAKAPAANTRAPSFGRVPRQGCRRLELPQHPGPGPVYNTRNLNAPKVIGGAIGDCQLPVTKATDTPGPGHYKTPSTLSKGGCSMGEAPSTRPLSAPAGSRTSLYAGKPTPPSSSYSFGSSNRPQLFRAAAAAEAQLYMPPSTLGGPAASCRTGHVPPKSGLFEFGPGPDTYCPASTLGPKRGGITIGRAKRPSTAPVKATEPGPGSYEVPSTGIQLRESRRKEPDSSSRFKSGGDDGQAVPGPGAYDLDVPCRGTSAVINKSSRDASAIRRDGTGDCRSLLGINVFGCAATSGAVGGCRGPRFPRARRRCGDEKGGRRDRQAHSHQSRSSGPPIGHGDNSASKIGDDAPSCVFGKSAARPPGPTAEPTLQASAMKSVSEAKASVAASAPTLPWPREDRWQGQPQAAAPCPGPACYKTYSSFG